MQARPLPLVVRSLVKLSEQNQNLDPLIAVAREGHKQNQNLVTLIGTAREGHEQNQNLVLLIETAGEGHIMRG